MINKPCCVIAEFLLGGSFVMVNAQENGIQKEIVEDFRPSTVNQPGKEYINLHN